MRFVKQQESVFVWMHAGERHRLRDPQELALGGRISGSLVSFPLLGCIT